MNLHAAPPGGVFAAALLGLANLAFSQTVSPSPSPSSGEKPDFSLVGFATVNGYGVAGTTGGGTAKPIIVHNAEELRAAVERSDSKKGDETPRVVKVVGDIDLGVLGNQKGGNELKAVGVVLIGSNTTVYAEGAGATIHHGTLELHGTHNVIIRNLKFRDLWELDPKGAYDKFGWDYIRIVSSGKKFSHHVWVDHCDFEKVYDGMVDITHGSDLITISWCRFAGDERGPQKKVSLIGHSSSESAAALDKGHLNVTLHHNVFENIDDRAPRVRFGNIHVFNNFINGAENANISVMGAVTFVENCVYKDTRIATTFSHAADAMAKEKGGTVLIVNSRNEQPRPLHEPKNEREKFENEHNFMNSVDPASFIFNAPTDWEWKDLKRVPYPYHADPVEQVPEMVGRFSGTGKIPAQDFPR